MSTIVVVGNPKPGSRTSDAARLLATALAGAPPQQVIDVIDLGAGLLGWGDEAVATAVSAAATARLLIVASPTFKASYSGILKLFLDQFATGEGLRGVVAVPLMLGAGPAHAMAPDLLLKSVLVELGAICPAPGLYLPEKTFADGQQIDAYVHRWGAAISAMTLASGARA